MEARGGRLAMDASIPILVPLQASQRDLQLAQLLVAELSDKYGLPVAVQKATTLPAGGRFILMGAAPNPLIQEYLRSHADSRAVHEPEGYLLEADAHAVIVAGADDAGALYGFESLRQLFHAEGGHSYVQGVRVRDWPAKPFRGVKLYLPGHENIAYFRRFVRDFMALYKYNQLIVEVNGAMRLDRHPEVNAGWLELARDMNATRRDRSPGPGRQLQDSANADAADGEVLERSEVAALVEYARQFHIEVVPEIPSLTHSYFLLARHRELAEIPAAEWPDTYCPSNPKVYDLLFDVLDEYIEVMQPRMVHVGHDEWRMPWGVCPLCKDQDPRELFAQDLNEIHDYLSRRGIRTAIWGDHLIEPLRGERLRKVSNPGGASYGTPGGLSAEQVKRLIPKDILVFNWFWDDAQEGEGEADDKMLADWGFEQAYGNMQPDIRNYGRRAALRGVIGGAPSSWAATNEINFGKDLMFDFLGCAQLLWSGQVPPLDELSQTVQGLLPGVRRHLSAEVLPSDHDPVVPVDIADALNSRTAEGINLDGLKSGKVSAGRAVFNLSRREGQTAIAVEPGGHESRPLAIGDDVSSIVFLHASAKPAGNAPAYEGTWNYADTADLLGWYEVTYEDGFVITIPLRYGVNVLEAGWAKNHAPNHLAYEAEPVDCGSQATFFSYEWVNPRRGIPVRDVRLKSPANIKGENRQVSTLFLAAVSVVKKRPAPDPGPVRSGE